MVFSSCCFYPNSSVWIKVWPVHQLPEEDQAASKRLWFEQLGSGDRWGAGVSGFQNGTGHLCARGGIWAHNRHASWSAAEQDQPSWHWLFGQHPLSASLHPLWNAHNTTSILFLFSALEPSDKRKKIYILREARKRGKWIMLWIKKVGELSPTSGLHWPTWVWVFRYHFLPHFW